MSRRARLNSCAAALLGVAFVALYACGVGGGGGNYYGEGDGDGDTDWQDNDPCTYGCTTDAQCCIGGVYPDGADFPGLECPGNRYPNDWDCVNNECVNAGCSADSDCPEFFECHDVNSVGFCLLTCTTDANCYSTNVQGWTECTGQTDGEEKYCVEPSG